MARPVKRRGSLVFSPGEAGHILLPTFPVILEENLHNTKTGRNREMRTDHSPVSLGADRPYRKVASTIDTVLLPAYCGLTNWKLIEAIYKLLIMLDFFSKLAGLCRGWNAQH